MQSISTQTDYDVVIIGGGLIGASFARAMAHMPLKIAIIESAPFQTASQPGFDDRSIALSLGSKRIFNTIGVWGDIKEHATAINKIHVSDQGRFGVTRLDHHEQGVEALGYVVVSRVMGGVLGQAVQQQKNVDLISPAQVSGVALTPQEACVTLSQNNVVRNISTRLIVAADGRESVVRNSLGIKTTDWDYGQTAVIANIKTQYAHNNVAYERFTNSGPVAVLPLTDERCAIVWTVNNADVDEVLSFDDAAFIAAFQKKFGNRLGKIIKAGERHAYPLRLVFAKKQVGPRLALIGNAAHSLHPIAGQGFNLGLRDVATLAEIIRNAQLNNQDIGQLSALNDYAAWRKRDHLRVVAFTDGLVRIFSNDFFPLSVSRNLGLLASDMLPAVKRVLTRQAMGLSGKLPRLARGLPLIAGDRP